jgi:ABC-type Zn uptake system ZnuABC Zn-binding protein ZnuA
LKNADVVVSINLKSEIWLQSSLKQKKNNQTNFELVPGEYLTNESKFHFWNAPKETLLAFSKLMSDFSKKWPERVGHMEKCLKSFEAKVLDFQKNAELTVSSATKSRKMGSPVLLTSHNSHGSLFKEFGLKQYELPLKTIHIEKWGAKDFSKSLEFAVEKNVDVVFYDEHFTKSVACKISKSASAKLNKEVKCVGPLESDTFQPGSSFETVWKKSLELVVEALK